MIRNQRRYVRLKRHLESVIYHRTDSVRYYLLCDLCSEKVEYMGIGEEPEPGAFRVAQGVDASFWRDSADPLRDFRKSSAAWVIV